VCASLSCPDLSKQVYEGDHLIEQLEKQAYQFLRNKSKGLHIRREQGQVLFSQIFEFDKKTFPNGAKDAICFIENEEDRKYLRSGNYEIRYLHYDWDLNSLQNAR